MAVLWSALFFLLGAAAGNFINVAADRFSDGKSSISPPSRCHGCQHRLSTGDLFQISAIYCSRCAAVIAR
ncbi:MAG: prepilin peptidase [Chloroflexi bacterium]|nr:prepilin peptidase [Chloroflexota bacterium]